jgi:dephospho-CoA kinase
MPKIYITGVSGTGKSTLATELNKRGILAFDVDAVPGLCHWQNKETKEKGDYAYGADKEWLVADNWVADEEQLSKLLKKADTVVVLGLTSNQEGYFHLFDRIFLLQCPPEVFLSRIDARTNNDFGKGSAEQEHILSWYKNFEKRMIDQGVVPVNTEQPIEIIADIILESDNEPQNEISRQK